MISVIEWIHNFLAAVLVCFLVVLYATEFGPGRLHCDLFCAESIKVTERGDKIYLRYIDHRKNDQVIWITKAQATAFLAESDGKE